jgi:hypothetical protein
VEGGSARQNNIVRVFHIERKSYWPTAILFLIKSHADVLPVRQDALPLAVHTLRMTACALSIVSDHAVSFEWDVQAGRNGILQFGCRHLASFNNSARTVAFDGVDDAVRTINRKASRWLP